MNSRFTNGDALSRLSRQVSKWLWALRTYETIMKMSSGHFGMLDARFVRSARLVVPKAIAAWDAKPSSYGGSVFASSSLLGAVTRSPGGLAKGS
jgi:hypothetical protein